MCRTITGPSVHIMVWIAGRVHSLQLERLYCGVVEANESFRHDICVSYLCLCFSSVIFAIDVSVVDYVRLSH